MQHEDVETVGPSPSRDLTPPASRGADRRMVRIAQAAVTPVLARPSANDCAPSRATPPLLDHDDLTATVLRYHAALGARAEARP